jgi:NarL family two-component system response regulator LiaR
MAKIKVLIVDDHGIVRQGLRTYLELMDDIEVLGEAENGLEAVAEARQHQPDVVLMDLVMPQLDGIEATRQLGVVSPRTKVIVLTSFADDEQVFPAIRAGAAGYLLKDVSPAELADAIRAVHRGEAPLHPDVTKKLLTQFAAPVAEGEAGRGKLTPREVEVLRHIARGMSNREIAQALTISERTVKTHVGSILGKLDLADRTQAAIYAHRHGIAPE